MSERVAIVAGAGGELGRATAEKLAAAGVTVGGGDRGDGGLQELAGGTGGGGGNRARPGGGRGVGGRDRGGGRPAGGAGEHHRHVPPGRGAHGDARGPAAHDRRQPWSSAVADPGG